MKEAFSYMQVAFFNMDAIEYLIVAIAFSIGWLIHCAKAAIDRRNAARIDEKGAELIESMDDFDLMEAVVKKDVTIPKRIKSLMRNVANQIEDADDTDAAVHFCRVLGGVKADIDEERENIKFAETCE